MITVHPVSQRRLDSLRADLPQSLLLTGERGVGLLTIAQELAVKQLSLVLQPKNAKGEVDDQNGTISVETIRQLYDQTRTKHTSRQIVIIDNADRLSAGAQGAFLKLLEEPNPSVYFILTSHAPDRLLPTIRSRVQQTVLHPITPQQTTEFLSQLGITDTTKQAQLHFIAEGLPAEIMRLVANPDYFQNRAKIMTDARQMLQAEAYDQLLTIQNYSDRSTALQLVDSMLLIARRSLSSNPQPRLVKQLEKLLDIRACIEANHNVRLQLARCVL
jgi:DNA polymerase III subunit delta'